MIVCMAVTDCVVVVVYVTSSHLVCSAKLLNEMSDESKKRDREYQIREADRLKAVGDDAAALDQDTVKFFSAEMKQHERRFHHTQAVRDKIARYDEDLQKKHDELNRQIKEYECEVAEIQRLQAHFDAVDAEEAAIAAEQTAVKLRRDRVLDQERKRHHAAVLIQKLFRGFYIKEKEKARRAKIRERLEAKLKRDGMSWCLVVFGWLVCVGC